MPDLKKTKIMIADDHTLILESFCSLLTGVKQFEVIGQARNGKDLLEKAKTSPPDIIITDIRMPVMDGFQVLKCLKNEMPLVKVIVLSMYYSDFLVSRLILEGACACLPKECTAEELITTIENVQTQGYYFNGAVSKKIMHGMRSDNNESYIEHSLGLTDREFSILELICSEKNNKEIGELLGISISTVEFHRKNIYAKTGASNIIGLVKYAIKKGIL